MLKKIDSRLMGLWGASPCKKRLKFEKKIIFNKERAILRKKRKKSEAYRALLHEY